MPVYEVETDEVKRLARLSQRLAGSLALCLGLSTLLRPLVVELPPVFTYFGWANTALMLALYGIVATRRVDRHAPFLLMLVSLVALLPLLSISGGVNSQYAVLIPLYPLCGALFAGRRISMAVTAMLIALIIYDLAIGFSLQDLTGEIFDYDKSQSRSAWLLIATVMSAFFAYQLDGSLVRLRQKLWDQANLDALTGLANRRAMDDCLAKEIARSQRTGEAFSLLIIDVDHFKRVNDLQGHAAGDRCLQKIAQTLDSSIRKGQDMVARFGGEEFVVLLSATAAAQALQVAEKIKARVSSLAIPYGDDPTNSITVTIGCVTRSPASDESAARILQHADRALYSGKKAGRNRVVSAAAL